jgi:surface carbohydrate biosynthesis protein
MYCCMPIGMKLRELDSHVLLALHLLRRGHRCIIGQRGEVRRHIRKNDGPFLLISNSVFFPRKILGRLAETGSLFVVLDQEGGVFDRDLSSLSRRTAPDMLAHVDAYLAWGEAQKEFLVRERSGLDPARIHVVGHPRFDVCRPAFAPFFSSRRPARDRIAPGYFLVNTSFGLINHKLGDDFLRFVMNRRNTPQLNTEYKTRRRELQRTVLPLFVEAVRALSARFPEQRIVVRPHPIERTETYSEALGACPNVSVICEGSVHEWIADAKLVMYYDCTSGIEAMMFGKPAISYCPVVEEGAVQWLPLTASFRIPDLSALLATVDQRLISANEPEYFRGRYDMALIKRWIANTDFSSADKIADLLGALMARGRTAPAAPAGAARGFGRRLAEAAWPRLRMLAAVTGLSRSAAEKELLRQKRQEFHKTTFDGLTAEDITVRLEWVMRAEGVTLPVAIRKLDENTYLLESERGAAPGSGAAETPGV